MKKLQYVIALWSCLVLASPLCAEEWTKGNPVTIDEPIHTESTLNIMAREALMPKGIESPRVMHPPLLAHPPDYSKAQNPEAIYQASTNPFEEDSLTEELPFALSKRRTHRSHQEECPLALLSTILTPNFLAATIADSGDLPPDSQGAVGPTQFFLTINGRFRTFDKTTGLPDGIIDTTSDLFFASQSTGLKTTDPRVRYDRFSDRWFVVMMTEGTSLVSNRLMIAVSDAGIIDSITDWTFYSFVPSTVTPARANPLDFADFPTLGIDNFALYVGVNVFNSTGTAFQNTDAFVIKKASIVGGGPLVVTVFRNLINPINGSGPFTPQGVDVYDAGSTMGHFIGVDFNFFGLLQLRNVSDPGGVPAISGNIPIPVLTTLYPLPVLHKGGLPGGNLDAIDDRLGQAHIRDGLLYTAHNIGVNNKGVSTTNAESSRDGARWYEISVANPASPSLGQAGTLFAKSSANTLDQPYFWMPCVMTNGLHSMALGCSTAGENDFINAAVARRFADTAQGKLRKAFLYTNSTTSYNAQVNPGKGVQRWGDYSHVSLDPQDNMTLWAIEEFCNATNSYGCQVVRIPAAPPPEIEKITPRGVRRNSGLISVNIKGESVCFDGSAFYDPGAGFAQRLNVVIPGVTVTAVQVIDAKHIRVVIDTTGIKRGIYPVTVINPDGQSSSKKVGLFVE